MSERLSSPDNHSETNHDPEVAELLEFLAIYNEIQYLMYRLIEEGPELDSDITAALRLRLQDLFQLLFLDFNDPESFTELEMLKMGLDDRALHPQPKLDIPEVGFFSSRINEITTDYERFGPPPSYTYASEETANLRTVAAFSHTDWRSVKSRNGSGDDVATYIKGVATIMADPIAYSVTFGEDARTSLDRLAVSSNWSVVNGRHRSLAARSLGEVFIDEANMDKWVKVGVEQD